MTATPELSLDDLKQACRDLKAMVVSVHDRAKTGLRFSAFLPASSIVEAAQKMLDWGYFIEDINGVDTREGLMAVYHFSHVNRSGRVAFRVMAEHENPEIPSISHIFQGAEWHERETYDFYDLKFIGNPNPNHLLLPGEFEGPPPLLKAPADRAPLSALGLVGEAEYLDPAWAKLLVLPQAASEGE